VGAVVIVRSGRIIRIVRIGDITDIVTIGAVDRTVLGVLDTSSVVAGCRGMWLWAGT